MRKGSENTGGSEQGREGMERRVQINFFLHRTALLYKIIEVQNFSTIKSEILFSLLLCFENLKYKILMKNSCRQAAAQLQQELNSESSQIGPVSLQYVKPNSELSQIGPVCSQVSFSMLGRLQSREVGSRCLQLE